MLYQRVPSRQVPFCPFRHFCFFCHRSHRKKWIEVKVNVSFLRTVIFMLDHKMAPLTSKVSTLRMSWCTDTPESVAVTENDWLDNAMLSWSRDHFVYVAMVKSFGDGRVLLSRWRSINASYTQYDRLSKQQLDFLLKLTRWHSCRHR